MVSTLIVGHLRKVGLLPTKVVELIDALIEIGMFVVVSGLLLCLPMFSSDMSSFRQQLVPPSEGYVIVSESYLKFGVKFPLHSFFIEILQHFGLIVFQVTPNGWAHMIRLFGLFVECGMGPPTALVFS